MSVLAGNFFADRASMEGKVAVVTGSASGIGLEFARRCALSFGMIVVMADVDGNTLEREAHRINAATPGRALPVRADVRRRTDAVRLLDVARNASPGRCVDAVLLNAGVGGAGVSVLRGSEADWRWVLDVNLLGVLFGLQVFSPAMAAQGRPGLVAVTASDRGLDVGGAPACSSGYATSKHGVIAMCESLEGELVSRDLDGRVQLSVLCAGLVNSNLWDDGRAEAQRDAPEGRTIASKESKRQIFERMGASVSDTIDEFLDGVARGKFICDSVPGTAQESFSRRAEYIVGGMMPSDRRVKWSKL
eukprot:CAMPEP_0194275544 /NCGR_PEP_ID=MMETSP0169-20130528/8350_1 /TAXON_ID=218684 /ORGANISM="Corethron pennatum, Strain L29A3" /LENGTH=303 /DNA_ID=CAMNT_0039019029 /DNA_START=98 /DNA_END=1009 /DNA_ORIENTATION=-